MVNFVFRKIFRGNLIEAISTSEIAIFRFPQKIFLKRESTFRSHLCMALSVFTMSVLSSKTFQFVSSERTVP